MRRVKSRADSLLAGATRRVRRVQGEGKPGPRYDPFWGNFAPRLAANLCVFGLGFYFITRDQTNREELKETREERREGRDQHAEEREIEREKRELRRVERDLERERREVERAECERETQQLERNRQVRERAKEKRELRMAQRDTARQQQELEQDARRFLLQYEDIQQSKGMEGVDDASPSPNPFLREAITRMIDRSEESRHMHEKKYALVRANEAKNNAKMQDFDSVSSADSRMKTELRKLRDSPDYYYGAEQSVRRDKVQALRDELNAKNKKSNDQLKDRDAALRAELEALHLQKET